MYPSSYIHPYSYDGDDTGPQARIEDEYLEFPEDQSPHQVLNEQFASHRQAYQGQSLAHQVHWETEQKMPQAMINSQPNQGVSREDRSALGDAHCKSFSSPQIEDRDVPVTSQDNKQGYKITDQVSLEDMNKVRTLTLQDTRDGARRIVRSSTSIARPKACSQSTRC